MGGINPKHLLTSRPQLLLEAQWQKEASETVGSWLSGDGVKERHFLAVTTLVVALGWFCRDICLVCHMRSSCLDLSC